MAMPDGDDDGDDGLLVNRIKEMIRFGLNKM
jgi:hypothetical protein